MNHHRIIFKKSPWLLACLFRAQCHSCIASRQGAPWAAALQDTWSVQGLCRRVEAKRQPSAPKVRRNDLVVEPPFFRNKMKKLDHFLCRAENQKIFETTTKLDKCLGKGYGSTKRGNPKNITQQEVVVLQIAWRASSSSSIPTVTEEYSNILPPSNFYETSNMFI